MPVYTYKCSGCKTPAEKLVSKEARDDKYICPLCGGDLVRDGVTRFATKTVVNGAAVTDKEIDLVVGADSEKKWMNIEKDKRERHERMVAAGGKQLDISVASGERFNHQEVLGGEQRRAVGTAYSAMAKERVREGVDFDGKPLK